MSLFVKIACEKVHISRDCEPKKSAMMTNSARLSDSCDVLSDGNVKERQRTLIVRPFADHAMHFEKMLAQLFEREAKREQPLGGLVFHVARQA